MTTEQIWQLLEIYRSMQVANTMVAYSIAVGKHEDYLAEQEEG